MLQSHENAIKNREETAKVICRNYDFKGYDYSPLEKAKVDEIVDKLRDVHRTQEALVKRMKVRSSRFLVGREEGSGADSISFVTGFGS
jgi:hypothetical protein